MSNSETSLNLSHVEEYFTHTDLPLEFRRAQNPELDLDFLAAIQAHHITRIPYENVALHYNHNPSISLNVLDIYDKLVTKGRGGYCMENNILLYHVLRTLGFQVYLTGARLHRDSSSATPGWSGWEHSVNLVTLADQKNYLVDVGYGGDGPITPLPLAENTVTPNIGTQEMRLLYGCMPGLSDGRKDLWTYQIRSNPDQAWSSGYAFHEIEFFQQDFEVMNFYTSQSRSCFLTTRLLVVKFLREGDKVFGKVILDQDKLKENLGGKNTLVKTCQYENERVKVLSEYFKINLTEEERKAIRGKPSALGS